jgi:hypothetical protein
MLCVLQNGVKGVFIGSHGQFPNLAEAFPWRCTTACGRPAMTYGQTDLVMSVPSLPPHSQRSRQVSKCLAPN